MNLKHFQFAVAIAESGSFSKAAKACHATQPTISNAIAGLEEELGGKLFTRTTRRVDLTAFGEHLLPYLRTILEQKHELEQAARIFHNPEQMLLRIGLSPLVNMQLLDRVLDPFRQQHPELKLFFKECHLDDLNSRMNLGQIDIAVIPAGMAGVDKQSLGFYTEQLRYVPCEDADYSQEGNQYCISALPDVPVIQTGGGCGLNGELERLFSNQDTKLKSYPGQALSYSVIEEWASLGIGAGILPASKISAGNRNASTLYCCDGQPAVFSYAWVWTEPVSGNGHKQTLLDYIQAVAPSLMKAENVHSIA